MIRLEYCGFPPSSGWDGLVEQRGAVLLSALAMTSIRAVGLAAINESRLRNWQAAKKYVVEGQRLEVNPSVDRYKREMANLSAALQMKEAAN